MPLASKATSLENVVFAANMLSLSIHPVIDKGADIVNVLCLGLSLRKLAQIKMKNYIDSVGGVGAEAKEKMHEGGGRIEVSDIPTKLTFEPNDILIKMYPMRVAVVLDCLMACWLYIYGRTKAFPINIINKLLSIHLCFGAALMLIVVVVVFGAAARGEQYL